MSVKCPSFQTEAHTSVLPPSKKTHAMTVRKSRTMASSVSRMWLIRLMDA
jgi:hypothetical protein